MILYWVLRLTSHPHLLKGKDKVLERIQYMIIVHISTKGLSSHHKAAKGHSIVIVLDRSLFIQIPNNNIIIIDYFRLHQPC